MEKISEHISYNEATRSSTAIRLGINNKPNGDQLRAMKFVAKTCFEPLRNHFGVPIKVESFLRVLRLNRAIGSTDGSQHLKGEAVDIDDDYGKISNAEMFDWLANNVEFDQIIWEFGNHKNPGWIHVSARKGRNRGRLTVAYKRDVRTHYKHFDNVERLYSFLNNWYAS